MASKETNQLIELNDSNLSSSRTYYFNLGEDFSQELVVKFFNLLNSIDPEDVVEITISSPGGDVAALFSILDIVNKNPERFKVLVSGICDSAALDFILMVDCEKIFLPSFIGGVLHNIGINTHTRDLENPNSDASIRFREYKKLTLSILSFMLKLGIDEEKVQRSKKGEDIFISRKEIIQACKFKSENDLRFKFT